MMIKRQGFPDYKLQFSEIEQFQGTPINDYWHKLIIEAILTLCHYDMSQGNILYPMSLHDIGRVLHKSADGNDELTKELIDDIRQGVNEIKSVADKTLSEIMELIYEL